MNFIDNNGHIFSIRSYSDKPIGYEYEENDYIFWMNDNNQNFLSVNNYYIKVINVLIPLSDKLEDDEIDDIYKISIEINSNKFFLLNTKEIQDLLNNNKDINDFISISENSFKKNLTNDDLVLYLTSEKNVKYALIPLYVIGTSIEEGSWYTNILINVYNKEYQKIGLSEDNEWCFITVGGVFTNECEALVINGKNMGIDLPKDIIKCIYNSSYYNEEFNTQLYNEKLKEYLVNYIGLRSELGNYNSVYNSLKWFGYSNIIKISKLLQTDNQFKKQFIRDYFDIDNDVLTSFKSFRNSTYISLYLDINKENGECGEIDFSKEFFGEGLPKFDNLFEKYIEVNDDINEHYKYIKPYYDYSFTELGLKLSCLKTFLKKYFLPIHLSIKSLSMSERVYVNDIKMIHGDTYAVTEPIIYVTDTDDVSFSPNNEIYFTKQIHLVDELFNEYKMTDVIHDWYYINDTCVNIPIKFKESNKIYNCVLLLERELDNIDDYGYYIDINLKLNIKDTITIIDDNKKVLNLDNLYFAYSYDKKNYSKYYLGFSNIINIIKSNKKEFITLNCENSSNYNELLYFISYGDYKIYIKEESYIIELDGKYLYIPSIYEININKFNSTIADCEIYIVDNFYLRIKYKKDNLYKVLINNYTIEDVVNILNSDTFLITENDTNSIIYYWENENTLDSNFDFVLSESGELIVLETEEDNYILNKNLITIKFLPSTKLLYESHFTVCQLPSNISTYYNNFIIYPKMISNEDISSWINSKFKLKLLVNNKWYFYDFTLNIPEPIIKLGKLEYNYWENENKFLTNFSQIKNLTDSKVEFNSFMYNPEIVNVNNINFHQEYINYAINSNLIYIDGNYIIDNFYYTIILNGQEIKLSKSTYKSDFYINFDKLSDYNKTLYIYNYNNITYIISEYSKENNEYFIMEQDSIDKEFLIKETDSGNYDDYILKKVYCKYNELNDTYSAYFADNNDEYILVNDKLKIDINIYSGNTDKFLDNYINTINLSNDKKYLNHVILYDLYKIQHIYHENYFLFNNSIINCKGIDFYFDNYIYNNGIPSAKIYITGTVESDVEDIQSVYEQFIGLMESGQVDIVNQLSNQVTTIDTSTDFNIYSINWNDLLIECKYFYYENVVINDNGDLVGNGEYTDKIYSIIYDDIYQYYGNMYVDSLNDIYNLKNEVNIELNEYSTIGDTYKDLRKIKYNNGKFYIIEENKIYNRTYEDIYEVKFNIDFYDTETNELYVPSNFEYVDFYKNLETNKDKKYKIKISLYFKDGKKYNNIVHNYIGYYVDNNNEQYGYIDVVNGYIPMEKFDVTQNKNYKKIKLLKKIELVYKDINSGDISLLEGKSLNDYLKKYKDVLFQSYLKTCKDIKYNYPGAHWYTESDLSNDGYEFYDAVNLYSNIKNELDYEIKYGLDEPNRFTKSEEEKMKDNFWFDNYFAKRFDINEFFIDKKDDNEYSINCKMIYNYEVYVNDKLNNNVKFVPCVYILDKNDKEHIYRYPENNINMYNEEFSFDLKSTDKVFYVFFKIMNVKHGDKLSGWLEPKLYTSKLKYEKIKYESTHNNECEVVINGKKYYYGNNDTKEIIELYNDFFSEEYAFYNYSILKDKNEIYMSNYGLPKIYKQNVDLNNMYLDYDFYLMHDFEYWYVIYISKDTINKIININDLIVNDEDKILYHEIGNNSYRLNYIKSNNQFLINRMKYISSEGINHFNKNDIIVSHIESNDRLPISIVNNSKWYIEPLSINMKEYELVNQANNEMAILSLPLNDNEYYKGYYNISVKYSLDKYNQHQFKNNIKLLVK